MSERTFLVEWDEAVIRMLDGSDVEGKLIMTVGARFVEGDPGSHDTPPVSDCWEVQHLQPAKIITYDDQGSGQEISRQEIDEDRTIRNFQKAKPFLETELLTMED